MLLTALAFGLMTALFVYIVVHGRRLRNARLPPGPFPLPIVGNLHQIGNVPYLGLTELARIYGDLMTVTLGETNSVVVSSIGRAREMLLEDRSALGGRPFIYTAHRMFSEQRDEVFHDYGPEFLRLRKMTSASLKLKGDTTFEQKAMHESEALVKRLEAYDNLSINLKLHINLTILNPIASMMLNRTYTMDDDEFHAIVYLLDSLFLGLGRGLLDFVPIIRRLPLPSVRYIDKCVALKDKVTSELIQQQLASFDGVNCDSFVKEMFIASDLNQSEGDRIRQIQGVICDMLVGGVETTTSTLLWGFIFAIRWPEAQRKLQDELDRIVGPDHLPTLEHRNDCVYTKAFINEVLRMSTVAPLSLPHKATKDIRTGGYEIPEGSHVLINLWQIHHDEREWTDPFEFRPERFIDDNNLLRSPSTTSLLAFSAGARSCIGERQARMQMFLIFSRVFHMFSLSIPPGDIMPTLQGTEGIGHVPYPYKVLVERRSHQRPTL